MGCNHVCVEATLYVPTSIPFHDKTYFLGKEMWLILCLDEKRSRLFVCTNLKKLQIIPTE